MADVRYQIECAPVANVGEYWVSFHIAPTTRPERLLARLLPHDWVHWKQRGRKRLVVPMHFALNSATPEQVRSTIQHHAQVFAGPKGRVTIHEPPNVVIPSWFKKR